MRGFIGPPASSKPSQQQKALCKVHEPCWPCPLGPGTHFHRKLTTHNPPPPQRHRQQPVSGTADPGVVKQDPSSRGSVNTRSGPQRVRMSKGQRPIGTAKGKQPDTEALCPPPPPCPADALSNEHFCLDGIF